MPAHDTTSKPQPVTTDRGQPIVDTVAGFVLLPVAVARRVLPDRGLPVYLGIGALAVADIVDWPVAVAAGLGYAALRRWGPPNRATPTPPVGGASPVTSE